MQRDLNPLFFPDSVAVIGASPRPTSLTGAIVRNLVAGGYPGAAFVVHPKAPEVHGVRAYPDLDALPEVPEMAVVGIAPDGRRAAPSTRCSSAAPGPSSSSPPDSAR